MLKDDVAELPLKLTAKGHLQQLLEHVGLLLKYQKDFKLEEGAGGTRIVQLNLHQCYYSCCS